MLGCTASVAFMPRNIVKMFGIVRVVVWIEHVAQIPLRKHSHKALQNLSSNMLTLCAAARSQFSTQVLFALLFETEVKNKTRALIVKN